MSILDSIKNNGFFIKLFGFKFDWTGYDKRKNNVVDVKGTAKRHNKKKTNPMEN